MMMSCGLSVSKVTMAPIHLFQERALLTPPGARFPKWGLLFNIFDFSRKFGFFLGLFET